MPPRKKAGESGESIFDLASTLVGAIVRPSIFRYVPHDKQIQFHSADSKGRLYIGGNRSGKTVGGITEDVYRLRGDHPLQRVPTAPVRGRIVTVSYTEGIKLIILPELAKWLPPSDLINGSWEDSYNSNDRMLTLANGSTCELMSYDQKLVKFAGTSRHFIHFDEEPPKDIFDECRVRLMDTGGRWYITMTPVEGMTWIYDEVYLPGLDYGSNITVIVIDTEENPYISTAEMEDALSGLDDNERKARKEGKFVQLGGLAFKGFNLDRHVISPLSDDSLDKIITWTNYASLDHGLNNPTAWLYHAVSPSGAIVTYDEIYDNERSVDSFAEEIHVRNSWKHRRAPDIYVGDPAIAQRSAISATKDSIQIAYMKAGVPILLGGNDQKIGIEKMNRYLGPPVKWVITANCVNLVRQMQRLRWKNWETHKKRHENNPREELHKKDDHATDSARYFFSMMNDLYVPVGQAGTPVEELNKSVLQALSPATIPVGRAGYYDDNLQKEHNTEWVTIDEHLGGIW